MLGSLYLGSIHFILFQSCKMSRFQQGKPFYLPKTVGYTDSIYISFEVHQVHAKSLFRIK